MRPPLALLCLLALLLVGCPNPSPTDAAAPPADALSDSELDAADVSDAFDAAFDVSIDHADATADRRDASDLGEVAIDVAEAPQDSGDAGCEPGTTLPCTCINGVAGARVCHPSRVMGFCTCVRPVGDGGVAAPPPRLLRPLSGTRVTSQRPTLRWELPAGVTRARVELCGDRACTRRITQQEVTGSSWRSPTALSPGIVFWRVQGLGADGSVAWTSATWEFLVRHRDTPVDSFYGSLHDFNGDGFDDVVAGTRGSVEELHVYLGAPRGIQDMASAILIAPEAMTRGADAFSTDVTVGDVNGDGLADLAVSEWGFGNPDSSPPDGGAPNGYGHVHVFTGSTGGLVQARNQTLDLHSEVGRPDDSHFGHQVALVDFNGDGFDDLITTRQTLDRSRPQVFLFLGGSSGLQSSPVSTLGSTALDLATSVSLRGVGDVDGDGYGDVALGKPYVSGFRPGVVVLHGNGEARLDARLEEISRYVFDFGTRVAGGDVNGDGLGDLFVASYGWMDVILGTAAGMEMAPEITRPPLGFPESGGEFGSTLGAQGDLNGDGYVDLVAAGRCDRHAGPGSCATC